MSSQSSPSVAKALEVTDAFMAPFNVHDWWAHFDTLTFPHIRIASGAVHLWNTPQHLKEYESHWTGRIEPDRSYSAWNSREVIHRSDDKVHLAVQFTRSDKSGSPITTYRALYIITCINDHWGIQARSQFRPPALYRYRTLRYPVRVMSRDVPSSRLTSAISLIWVMGPNSPAGAESSAGGDDRGRQNRFQPRPDLTAHIGATDAEEVADEPPGLPIPYLYSRKQQGG